MSVASDQRYLLSDQYRDASNFNARIELHKRFSTNTYGWHRWVFDQFTLLPRSQILELGCGPGYLWLENVRRIPEGWDRILSDFSPGMVQEAQQNLRDSDRCLKFVLIDAQAIPFKDETFDAVIANHMLYHVPDRTKAFSEIQRVLRPGGRLYASTNGRAHLRELMELLRRFAPDLDPWDQLSSESFSLESGLDQLARWFFKVTWRRYEDSLVITEASPLVAYVLSGRAKSVLSGERLKRFMRFVEEEIALQGAIRVTKDAGIFEAFRE